MLSAARRLGLAPVRPPAPDPARRRRRALRRLRDARGGASAAVALFALGAALTLGLVADAGRAYSDRARMQAWLDGVALAAAAELDGRADAIARADWVIASAMPEMGGAFSRPESESFSVGRHVYLRALPPGGAAGRSLADLAAWITDDPARARFVLLDSAPGSVAFSALQLLEGGAEAFTLGVRSVARPTPDPDCGAPILAVCAPASGTGALAREGVQMRLTRNRDSSWEPGEYGLVSDFPGGAAGACAGLTGPARRTCLLAIDAPGGRCPARVDFDAGPDALRVAEPLNTRFDWWAGAAAALTGRPDVSADVNTISGAQRRCDGTPTGAVSDSMGLPDAPCFHRGDCDWLSPPVARAALERYWRQSHGEALPDGPRTRAEVYLHEILTGRLDPEGPEDSTAPACNPGAAPRPQRRMLRAAVVDCGALSGTAQAGVPVRGHLRALLTAPVPAPAGFTARFDGRHQGEPIRAGDIPSQAPGPGNPGNHKAVGRAGETPNGQPDWGSGARGMSDAGTGEPEIWAPEDLRVRDARGRMTYDPYRAQGLMRIGVKRSAAARGAAWRNVPMIFDTAAPTGGDADLASTRFGHALIISEDGDPADPDDEARGGWLVFQFDRPTHVVSLRVIDAEGGGVIRLYCAPETDPTGEFRTRADGTLAPMRAGEAHDPDEMARLAVPRMGDGRHVTLQVDAQGVRTLAYFMPDSGAVDDLVFANDLTEPQPADELMLEAVELLRPEEAWGSVLVE